jgi:hypothetical protein
VIPEYGPDCDLCSAPAVHFLLRCALGHEWDVPAVRGSYKCRECGDVVTVSSREQWLFWHDVVGLTERDIGRPCPPE